MGNSVAQWKKSYRPSARGERTQQAVDAHSAFRLRVLASRNEDRETGREREDREIEQDIGPCLRDEEEGDDEW